jgi:hypothetical protein
MKLAFGRMLIVLAGAVLLCAPAFGTVLKYDTPEDWQITVESVVTDDFDSNGPNTSVYYGGGYTNPGVFTLLSSGTLYNHYQPGSPYYDWGSNGNMRGPDNDSGNGSVSITILASATAFAVELMSAPAGQSIYVTINDDIANTYTISTLPMPGRQFVGFTSTDPITTVKLTSDIYNTVVFDNLSVATAITGGGGPEPGGETPEVSTLMLCGSGLFAAGFWRRRRCA